MSEYHKAYCSFCMDKTLHDAGICMQHGLCYVCGAPIKEDFETCEGCEEECSERIKDAYREH